MWYGGYCPIIYFVRLNVLGTRKNGIKLVLITFYVIRFDLKLSVLFKFLFIQNLFIFAFSIVLSSLGALNHHFVRRLMTNHIYLVYYSLFSFLAEVK